MEQSNNKVKTRFVEYRGKKYAIADLSRKIGMNQSTFASRITLGWSVEKSVDTPIAKRNYQKWTD